jgi:hypothetical protein
MATVKSVTVAVDGHSLLVVLIDALPVYIKRYDPVNIGVTSKVPLLRIIVQPFFIVIFEAFMTAALSVSVPPLSMVNGPFNVV